MILDWALGKVASAGRLTLIDANGRTHRIEGAPGPECAVRLHDRRLHRQLVTNPWLRVGEAYMEGTLTIEEGTLGDLIEYCCINSRDAEDNPAFRLSQWLSRRTRWLQQHNPIGRARRNVAHHYDLSDTLYDLFLDRDRQYSCAYFTDDTNTLEEAQENKKRHLAAKLRLRPGLRVLDIGSGWGGLALYLAGLDDVDVTGVTLSQEQHGVAERRAAEAGLSGRVRFMLEDYRHRTGQYDRIVSVGMFEHVGARHYREFFAKLRELLPEDGVALLHSIGRMEPPGTTSAWLRKYIFPGGYTPAMSEVLAALERERLYVTDIEILRLHYAKTLAHWHQRFQDNRSRICDLYDERFCRMWEFYLKGCEMAFRYWNQMVFQMQIARNQDAVPLTRDYITDWERAQTAAEARRAEIAA
ncbi:MAG: cyclopropane-fatty-acyl-phospholipid synthase [Defluviicoccus sp.]|nr:cyclopropane-fatty-acyl-phospholipid synthase [Defluviicoccus sp.]